MIEMVRGLLAGERRALSRAITLAESTRPEDSRLLSEILREIQPHTGKSLRLGISGVPGAGKSTFIEKVGCHWIDQGHRLAVLAVDPSSPRSGGAILGDKTRMIELSSRPQAFIRPSPAGNHSGGVNRRSRESIYLCEAAGYDRILIETVGVGQNEVAVASMTDLFLLLMLPNSGDELQGMKKGVLEIADLVIINKADLDPLAASRARADLVSALHFRSEEVPVILISALTGEGLPELDRALLAKQKELDLALKRGRQQGQWFLDSFAEKLRALIDDNRILQKRKEELLFSVSTGHKLPEIAAEELFQAFLDEWKIGNP
ncbi:MAG: methylmalonyl Co-A mutase-associated GTPase MeaB [Spirochaetales bacterium]|nr:methylmalonyl Co-A mutase-associated GTPase MeaB [Spirochaetales bacterium]